MCGGCSSSGQTAVAYDGIFDGGCVDVVLTRGGSFRRFLDEFTLSWRSLLLHSIGGMLRNRDIGFRIEFVIRGRVCRTLTPTRYVTVADFFPPFFKVNFLWCSPLM